MGLFISDAFWVGAYSKVEGLFEGGLTKLSDICRRRSSLPKFLSFIIVTEQSKFKH